MSEHFELLDVYKALFSVAAGLILGFEREMKDKSAGLKTITVICLGSTLFSILSYKLSGVGDPTRIASYIVSGIGFLGAGVIFKEGFNVYGLTTAGVIWIAAAVGMSIGFGEIYMAFTFLLAAMIVINTAKYFTSSLMPQHHSKILKLKISSENFSGKSGIVSEIANIAREANEIGLEKEGESLTLTLEIFISAKELGRLEDYLVKNRDLQYFSF
ncbi:MgtC/SapB family protein [Marnyiella aurantia]|uniref:MgtC/SapB family protein n=1 Tax=Marnyiella aurantia TaxID=2758037 RepID=A0A7D7LTE7_9FLAO|nr:MgtC/SapB family protein [Marnyiella aurantia]MBA5247524.1 MgtC/SapB family protein [Marnyiella aurantia]MBP0612545.1 MgtC/SapB family protein [Marnyiella aurantia]QMS99277.1 MgtC/SapB family protein [Marnyiella aurantia]